MHVEQLLAESPCEERLVENELSFKSTNMNRIAGESESFSNKKHVSFIGMESHERKHAINE